MVAKEKIRDHVPYNGDGFLVKISRKIKKKTNKKWENKKNDER
jgi:hypothetical protein